MTAPRPAHRRGAGPFDRPVATIGLAVLVVLAVLATAWIGAARRRDAVETPSFDDDTELAGPEPEVEGDAIAVTGLPQPVRGEVTPLTGTGGLPEGWRTESGTWGRDDRGLVAVLPAEDGPTLAVTEVDALPWATVSIAGPSGGTGWGVVFGYTSPTDHFAVTVAGATARLVRVEDGSETELGTVALSPAAELVVALDVSDRNVAVHLGTTLLPSVQVPTVEAARVVGIRADTGVDTSDLRWSSIGVRARPVLDDPLVARGQEVTEMTPDEARRHLGP